MRAWIPMVIASCASANCCALGATLSTPPVTTPPGITLRDVVAAGSEAGALNSGRLLWRYLGDSHGKPLYTFDADGNSGRSSCLGACAIEFPPYLASGGTSPTGDWSLVSRSGEQRQWAYQGRPLYYYSGTDPTPQEQASTENLGAAALDPGSRSFSPKAGWRRATFQPEESIEVPSGVALASLPAADGYGFRQQSSGLSLYMFARGPGVPDRWTPLYAPQLAHRVGDFSIMVRADGRRQWAYQGQPLYTFKGDYSPDDLNGLLADDAARPALAYTNFLPTSVRIQVVPMRGAVMATSQGLTLYTETRYNEYAAVPGRFRPDYDDAKAVGTRGCVGKCLATWRPLLATAHDQASGFWQIEERADGRRQWAYKGCALYTYVGDKKLGDMEGNYRIIIVYGDPQGKIDLSVTGGDRGPDVHKYAGSGFYWHVVSFYN